MRKVFLLLAVVAGVAIYRHVVPPSAPAPLASYPASAADDSAPRASDPEPLQASYTCDGRVYCSQMKSCDEARWVLAHCPGAKMDGDRDGLPCEDRCGH